MIEIYRGPISYRKYMFLYDYGGFSGGLLVKNPPASAGEAGDLSLTPGSGRSLKKEMATCSSILAWEIHGQRSLVGYSPWGHKGSDTT